MKAEFYDLLAEASLCSEKCCEKIPWTSRKTSKKRMEYYFWLKNPLTITNVDSVDFTTALVLSHTIVTISQITVIANTVLHCAVDWTTKHKEIFKFAVMLLFTKLP